MKNFGFIVLSTFFVMASGLSFADETVVEKSTAAGDDVGRAAKKGAHRVEEALCMKGDIKCAGQKIGNHALEAKDATVDGIKKVKNKID
jgi:hypothetical protein